MSIWPGRLLTYEDYAAFPDDGVRREIIGGSICVTPAPSVRHQIVVVRIVAALAGYVEASGGGIVLVAPADVLLGDHDIVQPDVLFVAPDREGIVTERNVRGAPTLCVEVLSDPRTDRVRKRALYERAGVQLYWIVDADRNSVEVLRLAGERYADPVVFAPGDALTVDDLPGFSLDLAKLFA